MDLSEVRPGAGLRHPWETARAEAVASVLGRRRSEFRSVLDYGCGDGFTGLHVQRAFGVERLVGVDIHLGDEACGKSIVAGRTVELARDESALGESRFDLVLLCDVIEHVEDDRALVSGLVERRMAAGALMLVTVPAFQSLFSEHDRALRHYRRYTLDALEAVLFGAGLELLDGGYLFASLLAPRGLGKLAELLRGPRPAAGNGEHGVGGWRGGPRLTSWLVRALSLDNALLLGARRVGVTIPGLSAWALCKTR